MVRPAGLIAGLCCVVAIAAMGWIWMAGPGANPGPQTKIRTERAPVEMLPGVSETVSATAVALDGLGLAEMTALRATIIARAAPVPTPAEGAEHGVRHQWPALYASARFSGDGVVLAFDDAVNRYRITLDGRPDGGPDDEAEAALMITRPGKSAVKVTGLGPGPHRVRLDKISESVQQTGDFLGFFVPAGGEALAPPDLRARQIEFIGNSDTVGYGNLSTSRDCTGDEVFFLTDTQAAYGPQVARHFEADYQILAVSGIGMVRNLGGDNEGATMPASYPPPPSEDASVSKGAWSPDVVVLTLGSNDFATQLEPDEAWSDLAALRLDFEAHYVRFVEMLRSRYPEALLVLVSIKGYGQDYLEAHRKVLETLQSGGEDNIVLGVLPEMDRTGCHWHPSLKDHLMLADEIISLIKAQPHVWQD